MTIYIYVCVRVCLSAWVRACVRMRAVGVFILERVTFILERVTVFCPGWVLAWWKAKVH